MRLSALVLSGIFAGAGLSPAHAQEPHKMFAVEEFATVHHSSSPMNYLPGAQISVVCDEEGNRKKVLVMHPLNATPEDDRRDDADRYTDYGQKSKPIATSEQTAQAYREFHSVTRQLEKFPSFTGYIVLDFMTQDICRKALMSSRARRAAIRL